MNIICFTQIATFNVFYIDKWEAEYTLLFLVHVLFESQNHPIEMVHPYHGPPLSWSTQNSIHVSSKYTEEWVIVIKPSIQNRCLQMALDFFTVKSDYLYEVEGFQKLNSPQVQLFSFLWYLTMHCENHMGHLS